MGVLDLNGSGDGSQHLDPPGDAAPESAPAAAPDRERNDAGQFVPASQLQPETKESRREKAFQERVAALVDPIKKEWEGKLTASERALEELRQERIKDAQERARIQGMLEAMQRQPQAQQQQQPSGPDPEKLFEEADAALAANDYATHQKKQRAAYMVLMARQSQEAVAKAREEWQRSQPPQMPPHIQALMMQNPHVMAAGDRGTRKVLRTADDLVDDGMDRQAALAEAFRRTNEALAPKKTPAAPTYSRESASALSAVPTGRGGTSSAGSSGEGVRLTSAQEAAYQSTKTMWKDRAEYLQWAEPGKFGLGNH